MAKIHSASLRLICTLFILPTFGVADDIADDILNIAAILNVHTPAGKAANTSLHFALQEINGTHLNLTILESQGFVRNVLQVFRSEVTAILVQDPKISKFLALLAEEIHVPILSFSGSHGFRTTSHGSTYLLPTNQSHYDDMKAIVSIAGYFHWKSVVVLYEDNELWLNGVYQLTEALQEFQEDWGNNRTTISETVALSSEEQIRGTLVELNKSCVRAFIVHTSVHLALNMFSIAQHLGMMSESYVWVVTDSIASSFDSLSSSSIQTLQGVVGVKSVATPQLIELKQRLGLNISSDDGINRIGIQAYNSLKLVASAVSDLDSQNIEIGYDGKTPMNDKDFSPGSMMVLRGGELLREKIVEAITRNDGLENLEYEIVNVFGKSYKTVGFWKKDTGGLESPGKEINKLGAVIWPGDTTQVPNGYRTLKIAKINGTRAFNFNEFLGRLSGYTSDTFQAAVDSLSYNLPFSYEAFDKEKSGYSDLSDYDALVSALADGNSFDAVVGDATILYNRSLYVGFTQPYTQTGLVMMVRMERLREKTWTFLHPFSAALWATAGAFFVITAFLVWLMEHEDNDEFKGKVNEQVVTSLALSLSAFVFAQREEVKSTLGKGIVATWLFIALILNNSYTAHLTSILTVERLAPAITSMKSLSMSNVKVGYINTSFAKSYLLQDLKIHKDRLVPLTSPHDYVQKLSKGEVGAIVDESLYIQIAISLYPCEKLIVVDRGYVNTGGFGFFFRKGSPFLADITEAVLNVSEHHFSVQSIRNKWFGEARSCPDMESRLQSDNTPITPANLWILFVLTASIYALTALIHIGRKLHRSRQDLMAASHGQDFATHVMTMIRSLKLVRVPHPSIEI